MAKSSTAPTLPTTYRTCQPGTALTGILGLKTHNSSFGLLGAVGRAGSALGHDDHVG
jgi:hypothetical protein